MKISSASKKVLASALSAAMVVAFAPTVAFGLTDGDKVKVQFLAGEGTGSVAAVDVTATTANAVDLSAGTMKIDFDAEFKHGDYPLAGFVVDKDSNGKIDAGETKVAKASLNSVDLSSFEKGSTVNLIAYYTEPAADINWGTVYQDAATADGNTAFTVKAITNLAANHTYQYAVDKDGEVIYTSDEFKSATSDQDITWTKDATQVKQGANKVYTGALGKGTYTLTVTDKTTGHTWTDAQVIVAVTLDAGEGGYFTVNSETVATSPTKVIYTTKDGSITLPSPSTAGGKPGFVQWTKANGKTAQNSDTYAADASLTAQYAVARIASGTFTAGASADKGSVAFTAGDLPTTSDDADLDFKVEVTGPNGLAASWTVDATSSAAPTFTVDLGDTVEGYDAPKYRTKTKVASGEYAITVTPVYSSKYTGAEKDKVAAVTGKVSVVSLTLDANGGDFGSGATKSSTKVSYAQAGEETFSSLGVTSATPNTRNGYNFGGWSSDGTKATLVKTGDYVTTDTVLKAVWTEIATAGTITANVVATATAGTYTITAASSDSAAKLTYKTATTAAGLTSATEYTLQAGGLTTNADFVQIKATKTDANPTSVTLVKEQQGVYTNLVTQLFDTVTNGDPCAPLKEGSTTVHQSYSYVYKATTDAATAALKATGYATAADWNKAANAKAVELIKAYTDEAITYAKSMLTGAKLSNGTRLTAAQADIDTAVAAIEKMAAAAEKAQADADKTNVVMTVGSFKTSNVAAVINAIPTTVAKAADVAAAEAVDALIVALPAEVTAENYEAVAKAAAEAQAAYDALTAEQKKLVTADVQAITKAAAAAAGVQAQAELVKAQDKAAAATGKAQVKGTTYKIKAKGSKTIKIAKSASGAKVTLKQVSGTKYAKVSGTKVTLKKAAKKGKKYTIKVKAVCGATTTSTVSFKVLVK